VITVYVHRHLSPGRVPSSFFLFLPIQELQKLTCLSWDVPSAGAAQGLTVLSLEAPLCSSFS
jgi:hypothetical protein